jgi:U3 small nucleolar RNA-associated protein 18
VPSQSKYYAIGAKNGYICLMGQESKKLIFDLKMNGSCNAMAFSPCEKYLYSVGDEAEIYQWDLGMRKCLGKVSDTGAYNTTTIKVSPNGNLVATGSKMGSINLFHVDPQTSVLEESPFKTMMNLTTAITDLAFNHSSELLSFCSKWKKNAFKMAHIPSYTVY